MAPHSPDDDSCNGRAGDAHDGEKMSKIFEMLALVTSLQTSYFFPSFENAASMARSAQFHTHAHRRGAARHCAARRVKTRARLGSAWVMTLRPATPRHGRARHTLPRHILTRHTTPRRATPHPRHASRRSHTAHRRTHRENRQCTHGMARCGTARHRVAWHGTVLPSTAQRAVDSCVCHHMHTCTKQFTCT